MPETLFIVFSRRIAAGVQIGLAEVPTGTNVRDWCRRMGVRPVDLTHYCERAVFVRDTMVDAELVNA